MVRTKRVCCFAAMLLAGVTAQQSTNAGSTPTPTAASSTTQAPSSSITPSPESTMGIPLSLWSVATSLLTHYFPSTTITNVRSLTWPGTMVIGSKTYTIHTSQTETPKATGTDKPHATSATSTPAASDFGAAAKTSSKDQMGDKTMSIVIGVVVGCVALAIMGLIFFCLHRRQKRTGSFFLRRRTPSPAGWTPPHEDTEHFGNMSYVTAGVPYEQQPKGPQVTEMQRRGNTPPLSMHPAIIASSSRSTSDDNPFYTPQERSTTHLHEIDGQGVRHAELDHGNPTQRRSSSSVRDSRPPTPFSPLMMQEMPGPAQRPRIHVNPFASPEDREAEDVVSPIVPTRSPERRYSPIVHYPSWDEVSEFNFSDDERARARAADGGNGYRRVGERRDGRHELA